MNLNLLDRVNTELDAATVGAQSPRTYRGYTYRFTGLKATMVDEGLAGQFIARRPEGPNLVVVVPAGYVGPYEAGDRWHIGRTIPLLDFDLAYTNTLEQTKALLALRLQALYALIDQHVVESGGLSKP